MNRLIFFVKNNFVMVLFFVFLGISLFLGDGKQPFVDTYLALGILVCFFIARYLGLRLRPLPRPMNLLWAFILVYFLFRTAFSDSVGYSVSSTTRLIEGYLTYVLFYALSNNRALKYFSYGLGLLVFLAVLSSVLLIFVPHLNSVLPLMNLLYSTYGHNHLVDLLLFTVPLAILVLNKKTGFLPRIFPALVFLGILISFSRGAWLLVVLYIAFSLVKNRLRGLAKASGVFIVVIFAGWLILDAVFLSIENPKTATPGTFFWLKKQLIKPPPWQDPRLTYWAQALTAISERPWLGSGPGTFFLESKRLQIRQDSYSWFAHSFPLQTTVELGVVGTALFFILILYQWGLFINNFKSSAKKNVFSEPLFMGITLTLVYSFFEYNLDYLLVWVLFWAAAGNIYGLIIREAGRNHGDDRRSTSLNYVGLVWLGIFCFSSIFSSVANIYTTNPLTAFIMAPYQKDAVTVYLDNQNKDNRHLPILASGLIEWAYRADPDVLFSLAGIDPGDSLRLYQRTLVLDPQSPEINNYRKLYLQRLTELGDTAEVGRELRNYSMRVLTGNARGQLASVDFQSPELIRFYTKDSMTVLFETQDKKMGLSKFLYLLGLDILKKNPSETKIFWTIARETSPQWSFFHLELASLLHFVFFQDLEAEKVIEGCLNNIYARRHCQMYNTPATLLGPGSFQKEILAISKNTAL